MWSYTVAIALLGAVLTAPANSQVIQPDSGCGTTKGCFSACSASACDFFISWEDSGTDVIYTLKRGLGAGQSTAYIVLGMSTDSSMGNDYVMGCTMNNNVVSVFTGYNPGGKQGTIAESDNDVTLLEGQVASNILTCRVKRPRSALGRRRDAAQQWTYLAARGVLKSDGNLNYHGFPNKFISTKKLTAAITSTDNLGSAVTAPTTTTTSQPAQTATFPDTACGTSKGCFGACISTGCDFLITWQQSGANLIYTLSTPVSGSSTYIALGMSRDGQMGDDYVMACTVNPSGVIAVYTGVNPTSGPTRREPDNEVTLITGNVQNNILSCTVQRPIAGSGNRWDASQPWTYLASRGNTDAAGNLQYHGPTNRFISTKILTSAPTSSDNLPYTGIQPVTPAPTVQPATFPDTACGTSKGCFGACISTGCDFLITWQQSGANLIYTLSTPVSGSSTYIALGMSRDDQMGDDYVMACTVNPSGVVAVYTGVNPSTGPTQREPDNEVTLITGNVQNNILSCTVQRPIAGSGNRWDASQPWTYLASRGNTDAAGNLQYHGPTNRFISTKILTSAPTSSDNLPYTGIQPVTPAPTVQPATFPDTACGTSKGCFGACISTGCDFLITWQQSGANLIYTLSTPVSGSSTYIALGMSRDDQMGDDYVMACTVNPSGVVAVYTGVNPSTGPTQREPDNEVTLITGNVQNNILSCTVQRPIAGSGNRWDASQPWTYLASRGSPDAAGNLQYHGPTNRFISTKILTSSPTSSDNLPYTGIQPVTPAPTVQPAIFPDTACGTSKGCFGACISTGCDFLITWQQSGANLIYTLSTPVSGGSSTYIALGMSRDNQMGDDYVMACTVNPSGVIAVYTGVNPTSGPTRREPDNEVTLITGNVQNNVLSCTVQRPIAGSGNRWDASQPWTYLASRGSPDAAGNLQYHGPTNRFISTKTLMSDPTSSDNLPYTGIQPVTQAPPVQSGAVTKDAACGQTKGCFSDCSGSSCSFEISWQKEGDKGVYTIKSQIPQAPPVYVALGFSSDRRMGSDSVIGCAVDANSNVRAMNIYNNGKSPQVLSIVGTELRKSSFEDNVLTCELVQPITPPANDNQRVDISQSWILLVARSAAVFSASGDRVTGVTKHQSDNKFVSSQAVSVDDTVDMSAKAVEKPLVKAHGCLMISAWVFLASLGIVAARFYKPVWKELLFSEKVWFQIHRTCMILVFCATTAGFVIIFVEVKEWSDIHVHGKEHLQGHPIIGVIVMSLTLINPLMALIRPHPGTPKRPIFNWCHWFVGTAAHILAVVAIFFGVELYEEAQDYLKYILAAFVAWHILVELTLTFLQCACRGRNKSEAYEMRDEGAPKVPDPNEETGQIITIKKVILVAHFLVVASLAAVLIGLVAKGK